MKSILNRFVNLGVNPQISYQEARTISFLNGMVLLVLLLILLNITFTLTTAPLAPGVRIFLAVSSLHWILISFSLAFNYFGRTNLARIYFSIVAASFMSVYTLIMGLETRWSFFLPIIILLQFFIFPVKEKKWLYVIATYCAVCFVALEFWFTTHQPLTHLPSAFLLNFKYVNTFGFLFCAGAMGVYGYNTITRAERKLAEEHLRSENLLLNILPDPIAKRLKKDPGIIADGYENVTILFADIVDFTKLSSKISPGELIQLLNDLFSRFDELADRFGLEKIKTIGDAYLVVAGVPEKRDDHAELIVEMAMAMLNAVKDFNDSSEHKLNLRIGICSGPVVAGVIGKRKFSYDLWGDTVNTASRMESHGIPGEIQVTETTYELLRNKYNFDQRGMVDVKGKGLMNTFLLKSSKQMLA